MSVDFRARAAAKQAWLVRRSEPRRGLLLGLIAGGAIGSLAAFAVLSAIPSEMPEREPTGRTAEGAPVGVAGGRPPSETQIKTASGSSPGSPGSQLPAPQISGAGPSTPFTTAAVAARPSEPARAESVGSAEAPNLVPPVTAADPAVTRNLTSEPPVLAQGGGAKQKARATKKKKKVIVERRKPPRLHNWPREPRPRLNDWAYRNNFSFGGGYYGW